MTSSTSFYSINNWVVDKLITNWKQIKVGNHVAITREGLAELEANSFWRTTAISGVVGAVALPIAIPAAGIGMVGGGFAWAVGEAAQVGIGAGVGMGIGALGKKIHQDFIAGNVPSSEMLECAGVVCIIRQISKKYWYDAHHVEIELIPTAGETTKMWIDANHLVKLITKNDYEKRIRTEIEELEYQHQEKLNAMREEAEALVANQHKQELMHQERMLRSELAAVHKRELNHLKRQSIETINKLFDQLTQA